MSYQGNQGRGPNGEQLARELAPPDNLQVIVVGADATAIRLLDETARRISERLARHVTTSQIRTIFGTVRMIEQDTTTLGDQDELPLAVQRALMMLRPKLAYQYGRVSGRDEDQKKAAMGALTIILSQSIEEVLRERRSAHFRNFVDFFEAILAYHRYYGGKTS